MPWPELLSCRASFALNAQSLNKWYQPNFWGTGSLKNLVSLSSLFAPFVLKHPTEIQQGACCVAPHIPLLRDLTLPNSQKVSADSWWAVPEDHLDWSCSDQHGEETPKEGKELDVVRVHILVQGSRAGYQDMLWHTLHHLHNVVNKASLRVWGSLWKCSLCWQLSKELLCWDCSPCFYAMNLPRN